MDGWTEDVDKEKEKYEPHFRKLYRGLSCRFNIKPGTQKAMMYISQFLVFIVPRLLKKFSRKKEEPVKAAVYPWNNSNRVTEITEKTKSRPVTPKTTVQTKEVSKQIEALRVQMAAYQKQIQQQKELLKTQQLIQQFKHLNVPQNGTKIFDSPRPSQAKPKESN